MPILIIDNIIITDAIVYLLGYDSQMVRIKNQWIIIIPSEEYVFIENFIWKWRKIFIFSKTNQSVLE